MRTRQLEAELEGMKGGARLYLFIFLFIGAVIGIVGWLAGTRPSRFELFVFAAIISICLVRMWWADAVLLIAEAWYEDQRQLLSEIQKELREEIRDRTRELHEELRDIHR